MAKHQEENTLTLNFAEAAIHDKKEIRLFRDYADRYFLIGVPDKIILDYRIAVQIAYDRFVLFI